MKTFLKATACAVLLTAAMGNAGQYPFPQNMKYPHGTIIEYANTDMIKEHYKLWKQAWYNASNGWVYAPEGKCSTVSEAIAYGMLITVYMDEEEVFKNLYKVWTSNTVGSAKNAGMNWRIGCQADNGSATDADEDAALALVMASKQWNNAGYLSDATALINWIAQNDVDGNNSLKPGSNWNPALNPSYVVPGHYRLFEKVTNNSKWSTIRSKAMQDLLACQDSKTGLVGDWCSWSDHKTISSPGAAVSNDIGFYDDAARTPWRTAWAYYWYGDSDAQKFNETVTKWLIPTTRTASGVNSGYKWQDYMNSYIADESDSRNFVSSTFSGGLGLATSSINTDEAKSYLNTVFKVLKEKKSCASVDGCGESIAGEKYYPATLNMLYLLILTGNMPNLYDLSGFTRFTPDTTKAPSVNQIGGTQMERGDTTVGVSGLWNWGAYHDKLGIGTKMVPDSGSSPLFRKDDGSIYAEASMEIGPEPAYVPNVVLKYPSAGIAVSFKKEECKQTKTCGVDFTALGIKYVRVTAKTSGPIRMAVLNTITDENAEKGLQNLGAGSEPGIYVDNSDDYVAVTYDMTPDEWGFKGANGTKITILDWVNKNAPPGADIIKTIKGFKWEVKDAQGGIGEISIKKIEFLDANKQAIDPVKLTGIVISDVPASSSSAAVNPGSSSSATVNPESSSSGPDAIHAIASVGLLKVVTSGMQVRVLGARLGSSYAVFDVQGKAVVSGRIGAADQGIAVPHKGIYLVRVDGKIHTVTVK
ncbi:glycosyl hydrolase family 8 [Fibrobacter sp. UBA3718]|uniref:glycosyl hydrolase family 8 n=1 Tax=Fibrobacter sp. UBA3718 TaxID=1946531 RepID=UPI0025BB93D3|nr:glycosyl hydrolase family 8 [Fibrobacter sp. UBA3718]